MQTRRYIAKMITMFKIKMGIVADYLFDIIPSKRETVTYFNTRYKDQFNTKAQTAHPIFEIQTTLFEIRHS